MKKPDVIKSVKQISRNTINLYGIKFKANFIVYQFILILFVIFISGRAVMSQSKNNFDFGFKSSPGAAKLKEYLHDKDRDEDKYPAIHEIKTDPSDPYPINGVKKYGVYRNLAADPVGPAEIFLVTKNLDIYSACQLGELLRDLDIKVNSAKTACNIAGKFVYMSDHNYTLYNQNLLLNTDKDDYLNKIYVKKVPKDIREQVKEPFAVKKKGGYIVTLYVHNYYSIFGNDNYMANENSVLKKTFKIGNGVFALEEETTLWDISDIWKKGSSIDIIDGNNIYAKIISHQKRITKTSVDKLFVEFEIKNNSNVNIIIPFSDYRVGNGSGYLVDSKGNKLSGKYIDGLANKVTKLIPTEKLLKPGESCGFADWIFDLNSNTADGLSRYWKNLEKLRGTEIMLIVNYNNPKIDYECKKKNKIKRVIEIDQSDVKGMLSPPGEKGVLFCKDLETEIVIKIPN